MLEKVLITGGTGFIGSHLTRELVRLGITPTVLSRKQLIPDLETEISVKVNFVHLNLCDHKGIGDFVADFRPSAIVNLAGTTNRSDIFREIHEDLNFKAAINLFEAANTASVQRIVQIGTADEYGKKPTPQSETYELDPVSEYASSKSKATKFAQAMFREANLPIIVLRPFTVYGEGQPAQMFLSQLIHCALRNEKFEMTQGLQKRDYVFVEDMVDAILSACTVTDIEGEVFNVGTGTSFRLRYIAQRVWSIVGADPSLLQIGARPAGTGELHDTLADITKSKKLLKWEAKVSFEDGLERTITEIEKKLGQER